MTNEEIARQLVQILYQRGVISPAKWPRAYEAMLAAVDEVLPE